MDSNNFVRTGRFEFRLFCVLLLVTGIALPVSCGRSHTPEGARIELTDSDTDLLDQEIGDVPDVELINQEGKAVSFDQWDGQALVVGFIYTNCPDADMCPLMTKKMATLQEKVASHDFADRVQFVSITFDPKRDGPEVLKAYGQNYDVQFRNWTFLTGKPEQVETVTEWFEIKAKETKRERKLQHNLRLYVIEPGGKIARAYRSASWSVYEVLKDLKDVVSESKERGTQSS